MKEINPIAFRLGNKFFWQINAQPKYFTTDYILTLKTQQFIHILIFDYFIIIIFHYKVYNYKNYIIIYLILYVTNLTYKIFKSLAVQTKNNNLILITPNKKCFIKKILNFQLQSLQNKQKLIISKANLTHKTKSLINNLRYIYYKNKIYINYNTFSKSYNLIYKYKQQYYQYYNKRIKNQFIKIYKKKILNNTKFVLYYYLKYKIIILKKSFFKKYLLKNINNFKIVQKYKYYNINIQQYYKTVLPYLNNILKKKKIKKLKKKIFKILTYETRINLLKNFYKKIKFQRFNLIKVKKQINKLKIQIKIQNKQKLLLINNTQNNYKNSLLKSFYKKIKFQRFNLIKVKKQINKLKTQIKQKNLYYYKQLLCKFTLENILFSLLKQPNKIFLTHHINLFINTKKILYAINKVYRVFHYLQRNDYFIDIVNILGFNMYFKKHNIISLLYFITHELHRTKRHRWFLNNLCKVLKEFCKFNLFLSFKLIVLGPIGKHGRTKIFKYELYHIKLQTYQFSTYYNIGISITKFGVLGIRIWVH